MGDTWSRSWKDDGRHRAKRDDWEVHPGAPPADGRAARDRGDDYDGARDGGWGSGHPDNCGTAWNGWSHCRGGGFDAPSGRQHGQHTNGRASEKLTVPSFTGDDVDDVGGSARSYLRQVEAWRRMTYLRSSQQGLVLYQHLGGKAWIAAEELSLARLGSHEGVTTWWLGSMLASWT